MWAHPMALSMTRASWSCDTFLSTSTTMGRPNLEEEKSLDKKERESEEYVPYLSCVSTPPPPTYDFAFLCCLLVNSVTYSDDDNIVPHYDNFCHQKNSPPPPLSDLFQGSQHSARHFAPPPTNTLVPLLFINKNVPPPPERPFSGLQRGILPPPPANTLMPLLFIFKQSKIMGNIHRGSKFYNIMYNQD